MGRNTYGYGYDLIGNRTVSTNNAEVLTYLANALNQYTNIADGVTNRPTYDLDGNMLTCGGWAFAWDGENRMNSASNGTTTISFGYDHMGRRFRKIVAGAATTTNTFLYDGWAMAREVQGGTTNAYVYGLDHSGNMQGAGTIGGLLFGTFGGTATVSSAFYAYDANGNVTTLIDTNGATAASYTYDPYGNTIAGTGALATINPFRFSTKYLDAETGFYYYGYRYYSSELGRWINKDLLGESGGKNLYCFVQNSVVDTIDILGTSSVGDPDLLDYDERNLSFNTWNFKAPGYGLTPGLVTLWSRAEIRKTIGTGGKPNGYSVRAKFGRTATQTTQLLSLPNNSDNRPDVW